MSNIQERLMVWKTRLLDTSRRNRLLHLQSRRGHVRVVAPDADGIFEILVGQGRKMTFVPRYVEDANEEGEQINDGDPNEMATAFESGLVEVDGIELTNEFTRLEEDSTRSGDLPTTELDDRVPSAFLNDEESESDSFKELLQSAPVVFVDKSQPQSTEQAPGPEQVESGREIRPPAAEPRYLLHTDMSEGELTNALYHLRSNARTALEEQGVNVLFLSFGILNWVDGATKERMRSPLLLVPVALERTSVTRPFTLTMRDQDILLNPTLTHKLFMDFRIQLPRMADEGDQWTPDAVLEAVRATVASLPGWSVEPDVYLELYSFEKLVMLNDLDAHAQEISEHPLLLALGGDASNLAQLPQVTAQLLDDANDPAETFQVLEADASQQEAIEWAKRGVSFVIQGPPGTGKSQTIANIISETLGQGKRVLFVSAKMAALEVVAKRLADCGLANFYLEAHSHHSSRGALVAQLGQALNENYPEHAIATERLARLSALRGELNSFARALHTPIEPLGQSPFHVFSALAGLAGAADLFFEIENIHEWDAKRFAAMLARLESLGDRVELFGLGGEERRRTGDGGRGAEEGPFVALHSGTMDERETNEDGTVTAIVPVTTSPKVEQDRRVWRGVALSGYTFRARSEIEFRFGELMQVLARVEPAAGQVADALTLSRPHTLEGISKIAAVAQHALETPTPSSAWFRPGETEQLREMATEASVWTKEYTETRAKFSEQFSDALLQRFDLDEMAARLEQAKRKPLRGLDGKFRQDMRVMREMTREGDAIGLEQALLGLEQARTLKRLDARMKEKNAELAERFGRGYKGFFSEGKPATDWQGLVTQLDWVDEMCGLFDPESVPETFINLVCNRAARVFAAQPLLRELRAIRRHLNAEWDFLTRLFPQDIDTLYRLPLAEVRAWIAARLVRIEELQGWLELRRDCAEIERLGGAGFLESARAAQLEGDQLGPAFLKRFYWLWLDGVYEGAPILAESEELYRKEVAQFCKADREQQQIARERLQLKLAAARPSAGWTDARSSEVTMLKREMAKRKHHKSFRRLASEIPNLLQALKPCLMMSPLSVSQYLLTAPVKFDLVIFDEASQIPPEEAIPAILRARQMIVAGDSQQLPPTPFFQSLGELEQEEWQDSNTLESLLQEASVVLPEVSLRWHYRSRHEALPAFSNHHFYEDRLVTFPNAVLNDSERGVCFAHVPEGIYDRAKTRTNPMEARRVAELVLEHFQRSPERSLGVVTFSQPQREAVDMEVQNLLRTEPGLEVFVNGKGSDAFFVKSLENVQGDERDVMIFSVGYGKDVNGALTMNFGPLNGEDGARRLNVAITRARDKVVLVSSILPVEVDVERTNSRGVQLLRAYMEYAMRGGARNAEWTMHNAQRTNSEGAALREQVKKALLARGYEVHADVGVGGERVDLALVDGEDPNRYALGIEFDGETFRQARTARDRERLRMQVLENLGWRMYRVRAKDWAANPVRQMEKITQLMAALETPSQAWSKGNRHASQPASAGSQETGEREPDTLVPTGMMMYRYAELERQGTPEQFFRAEEGTVQELFVQLAEQEGPVHWNAAARRIAGCWGISRVTTAVENHLDEILSDVVTQGRVVLRDDFLWSPITMDVMVRRPGVGQEPRPIEEIAPEEIAKAAYLNLKNALSLTEEDWVLLTARVLGFPRVTERVKRRILAAARKLDEEGMVKREEGKVVLKMAEVERQM